MLSLLAAVVQLNSAFDHVATTYMNKINYSVNCDSSRVQQHYQPYIDWQNFTDGAAVECWNVEKTFPCWSEPALIDLNKKVHLHLEETMRALVNVFTKVTCTLYKHYLCNEVRLRKTINAFELS